MSPFGETGFVLLDLIYIKLHASSSARSKVLILRKFCFKTHYEARFTLKGFLPM